MPLQIPPSYSFLPLETLKITHVPSSSPSATPILILTLNRPRSFNAATKQMLAELLHVYELFAADLRVRVIVLTGAGPAFCVGADLSLGFRDMLNEVKELQARGGGRLVGEEFRDVGGLVTRAIHQNPKPTLAAINGPAAGFGITLTLASTTRLARSSARISFPFARLGVAPESCSSFFLPRLVGLSRALHLLATGATYRADHRMLEMLFSEVVEGEEEVVGRAVEVAGEMVRCSGVGVGVVRDLVDVGLGVDVDSERDREGGLLEAVHRAESRVFAGMLMSEESREGMRAFMEKREPVFQGDGSGLEAVEWKGRASKM